MSLFRREAMEARSKAGMGEVIIIQPRIFKIMTLIAVGLVLAAAALAAFGQFSRKETVIGYLAPEEGVAALYATRGGVVSEVLVAEGEMVEAGQVLVRVATDAAADDGEAALATQVRQIEARLEEARLQLDVTEARFEAQQSRLTDRHSALSVELDQLRERLSLARESEAIVRAQWQRFQTLSERDLAPSVEVAERRQALIEAQASSADISRLLSEREAERRDAKHALSLAPSERDLELSRLREQLQALEQNRSELRRAAGYALTATVSGQVTALQAVKGTAVSPNQPLAAILPEGSDLRAHLLAPTRAAGFITPGQEVRLRVDAFPYQRFGAVPGRIIDMSGTVIAPNELAAPVMVQEPVYRLTVALDSQTIDAYGTAQSLQAGMALQADILVDRRPLWRWFIDPVVAARGG